MKNYNLIMTAIQDASAHIDDAIKMICDEPSNMLDDVMPLLRAAPELLNILEKVSFKLGDYLWLLENTEFGKKESPEYIAQLREYMVLIKETINKAKGV